VPATGMTADPLIIVGTGSAGYGLLRAIRQADLGGEILIVTADEGASYSKSQLLDGVARGKEAGDLVIATADQMAHRYEATVLAHTRALAIDRERRVLLTSRGDFRYARLVLATGAEPLRPPVLRGTAADKVLTVSSLSDYRYFRHQLAGRQRVAILGGSAAGCEFADHLQRAGCAVYLFEAGSRLLVERLPALCASRLAQRLAGAGVHVLLEQGVHRVDHGVDGLELTMLSGERMTVDVVLSLQGVRPRTGLAARAGLEVRRGIVADLELRTSDPDIRALGRCAEIAGRPFSHPDDTAAASHVLARILAGGRARMVWAPRARHLQLSSCPLVLCDAPPVPGEWVETATRGGVTARYLDGRGILRGFVLMGDAVSMAERLSAQLAG